MKFAPLFARSLVRWLALAAVVLGSVYAQDASTPPAAAAVKRHGYTVTVDIKVDEKGETKNVSLVSSDDRSTGEFITKMALAMALKTDLPPREKNGKPAGYTARTPFFFPIDDDEGPDAEKLPLPRVKNAVQPDYPAALREQGTVGGAILELSIDETGKLTHLATLRASHPEFEAAARASVSKWEFTPAQREGAAVASRSRIAIVFETEEKMADLKWRVAPRPSLGVFMVIRPDGPIDESLFDNADGQAAPQTPAPASAPAGQAK